jgi:TolB-like protein/Tfp pilus assembly protein PilF
MASELDPDLTIHIRGPFRVSDGHGAVVAGLSRRAQALLAVLSQQPGLTAERGRLADLLWSDRGEDQARASLRQELSGLRRRLPPGLLEADRQSVRLSADRVRVDMSGPGDILEGFDLASEGFEDWLRDLRQQAPADPAQPRMEAAASEPRHDRPSLAVLPFVEFGASSQDMFADGIVEEITGALGRMQQFDVIARQSAFALQGAQLDLREVAQRLGADYIVEGAVQRAGERVRISVTLSRGSDAHTVWTARLDDRIDDLFDLQDRVAAQVAGQVSPNVRMVEIERARSRPPNDRTAYDLLLLAYPKFWTLREQDNAEALRIVSRAVDRDPEFAHALALKAWILAQQVTYMWSRDPAAERQEALDLAERASRRAGHHVPTLVAIAATYAQAGVDHGLARHHLTTALKLDPNNAWAWLRQGWLHQYVGEVSEAMDCFDTAERLSPLDPFLHQIHFGRAAALYRWTEDADHGLRMIEEGLLRFPGVIWPLRMLAVGYMRQGRTEKAQDAAARLLERLPHLTIAYLRAALPPIATNLAGREDYFDMLARAGIPER